MGTKAELKPIVAQIIDIGDLEVKCSAFIHFASQEDCKRANAGHPIVLTWDVVDLPSPV